MTAVEFIWSSNSYKLDKLIDSQRPSAVIVRAVNNFNGGNGIDDVIAGQVGMTSRFFRGYGMVAKGQRYRHFNFQFSENWNAYNNVHQHLIEEKDRDDSK